MGRVLVQGPFHGVAHEHPAAFGAGHRTAHQEQAAILVGLHDLQVLRRHPHIAHVAGHLLALEDLAGFIGTRTYERRLRAIYQKLESIPVDYAVLEPATRTEGPPRVFVIPAEIGWSDIGSWAAVYELLAKRSGENVLAGAGHALDSEGNFLWSPSKFVAAIGVRDLVVVETRDALLICPRDRAQDVAKIVKTLEQTRRSDLL